MDIPKISKRRPYMNPYVAGIMLGVTLLASFLTLGAGLGASGGLARVAAYLERRIAPAHTAATAYFGKWGTQPLRYYLVFMLGGIFVGGAISALSSRRFSPRVERGRACSAPRRILFAFAGGVLAGWASRLAQGCTSGQALTGGALLLTGSLVFMACVFAGGYAAARFVRSQWYD
jgi:uncharacterized membrane protein YedE/YeeE